jgi:hypothetical protein
VVDQRVFKLLL